VLLFYYFSLPSAAVNNRVGKQFSTARYLCFAAAAANEASGQPVVLITHGPLYRKKPSPAFSPINLILFYITPFMYIGSRQSFQTSRNHFFEERIKLMLRLRVYCATLILIIKQILIESS